VRSSGEAARRRRVAHCAEEALPYRRLAMRVISQALNDAADPGQSMTDRESARLFLAGSSMLHLWCQIASLDPQWMAARAVMLTAGRARASAKQS
jgi:hypothetical protein